MKPCLAALALVAAALAAPVHAGDDVERPTTLTEAQVRAMSDATYTWILGQALKKGHRYTPQQIDSGYERHFGELKVRLIGEGYTILEGEAGA